MGSCRCVRFSRRGGPVIPVLDGLGNGRCGRAECPACSASYEFRIQVAVNPKIRAPAERAGPQWLYRTGQAQWPAVARPLGHVCRSSCLDSQSVSGLSRAFSSASTCREDARFPRARRSTAAKGRGTLPKLSMCPVVRQMRSRTAQGRRIKQRTPSRRHRVCAALRESLRALATRRSRVKSRPTAAQDRVALARTSMTASAAASAYRSSAR